MHPPPRRVLHIKKLNTLDRHCSLGTGSDQNAQKIKYLRPPLQCFVRNHGIWAQCSLAKSLNTLDLRCSDLTKPHKIAKYLRPPLQYLVLIGYYLDESAKYLRPPLQSLVLIWVQMEAPPAPRKGYTMYYDHSSKEWVLIKVTAKVWMEWIEWKNDKNANYTRPSGL